MKSLKNKFNLVVLGLLTCVQVQACNIKLPMEQEFNPKIQSIDSIPIAQYNFKPRQQFNIMLQNMIDSCESKIGCNKLEHVFLEVEKTEQSKIIFFSDMKHFPYLKKLPMDINELASFKINETFFYMNERDIFLIDFLSKNKILLNTRKVFKDFLNISYSCLNAKVDGSIYDALFFFKFETYNETDPILLDYSFLIDSGDTGFFKD